jgi:UDP-N-acetyl-D-mannosaminuronate dehydrogenase
MTEHDKASSCRGVSTHSGREDKVRQADCVIILTDCTSIDYEIVAANVLSIVDTHNVIKCCRQRVFRLGDGATGQCV